MSQFKLIIDNEFTQHENFDDAFNTLYKKVRTNILNGNGKPDMLQNIYITPNTFPYMSLNFEEIKQHAYEKGLLNEDGKIIPTTYKKISIK